MINIGTPRTVSLWTTPPKGSFILMIYLPEEEIVQLDIAVIGSGDCSFHPLDKLLLCLNVHFFIWKLMFVFILFHSKLTTDENFECACPQTMRKKVAATPGRSPRASDLRTPAWTLLLSSPTLYSSIHFTLPLFNSPTLLFPPIWQHCLFSHTKRFLRFLRS